jgi:hypothetical protein
LANYRLWVVALLVVMVGLYAYWSGTQFYYPVTGTIRLADGTPVVGAEVSFQCDDPTFNFTRITDAEGRYQYASVREAGGAPAGTEYRVRLVPKLPHATPVPQIYQHWDTTTLRCTIERVGMFATRKKTYDFTL